MEEYSILGRIGEGAHGIVFKAKHIEVIHNTSLSPHWVINKASIDDVVFQTGETVALKKVALRRLEDGIPNQALREIKALQEIEDNQHVSVGIEGVGGQGSASHSSPFSGGEAEGRLPSRDGLRAGV